MILSKKPEVSVEGTAEELVNDVANIVSTVLKAFRETYGDDRAKELIRNSVEIGFAYEKTGLLSEKPLEQTQPELDEIEKAMDELFERFRGCFRE